MSKGAAEPCGKEIHPTNDIVNGFAGLIDWIGSLLGMPALGLFGLVILVLCGLAYAAMPGPHPGVWRAGPDGPDRA